MTYIEIKKIYLKEYFAVSHHLKMFFFLFFRCYSSSSNTTATTMDSVGPAEPNQTGM